MKKLFLYGVNCTKEVWNDIKKYIDLEDTIFVEYPHSITKEAKCVSDITKWVYDKYKNKKIDCIIGHSLGGIIALELVTEYKFKCDNVILIDSNLKPAKEFYRNLMTEENMKIHGDRVMNMIKGEKSFYREELMKSLQEEFDYTNYAKIYSGKIYGIYGDRGVRNYPNKISDFCLDSETEKKIDFRFIKDSCHMIMIENPVDLANEIKSIYKNLKGEQKMKYKKLNASEVNEAIFEKFERHQVVTKCWRKVDGEWIIKDISFVEQWGSEEYKFLVQCLRNTINTGGVVYAAFDENILKGFTSVEPKLFGKNNEYLNLSSIHVSEELRGKGIGQELFKLASEWAKEHGAKKLYISAHSSVESQAFYKSLGCVEALEYNKEHVENEPCDCQLEYVI